MVAANGPPKSRPKSVGIAAASAAPTSAPEEDNEKPIAAVPLLGREVFLYMEPRDGLDGASEFGTCAACENFIPENAMRGAVRGDRCKLFGSDYPVDDPDTCGLWAPWPGGKACDGCVTHGAGEMIMGMRGSVSPYDVGYKSGMSLVDTMSSSTRCSSCRQFDFADSECEFFEELNEKLPAVFACEVKVKSGGACNAWARFPDPEPIVG